MTTNPDDPLGAFFGGANPFGPQHAGAAAFTRGFVEPNHEPTIGDWKKRLVSRLKCNAWLIERLR